jgi:phosphoribosylformylglycinamidine synthase
MECAQNLACAGAEPLGTTNNLNFGNPEKEHIAWQLTRAVAALGDACRELAAPIVGGNVSLYNEGPTGPIYPTPVIGMVGLLPDARRAGRIGFRRPGDAIALLGPFAPSLAASELEKLLGRPPRRPPGVLLRAVRAGQGSSALPSARGSSRAPTTSPRVVRRRAGRVLPGGQRRGERHAGPMPSSRAPVR